MWTQALSKGALCVAMGSVVAAAPARGAEEEPRTNDFEITPFVGYMGGGDFEDPVDNTGRNLDSDNTFGVIMNAAVDSWRHYELIYTQQSTQLGGVTPLDMDIQYLHIGGIVSYPDARRAIPYFGLTIGATRFSPNETGLGDETKLSFSAGTGLRIPITDHIGVRFDARAFVTLLDTSGNIFCVSSSGLTCRIRAKSDTFLQYQAALGVTIGF